MDMMSQMTELSFGGIEFPYKSIKVRGGIRRHEHNYPRVPGAAHEKLGRKPYEIDISANFEAVYLDPKWRYLYPNKLHGLQEWFERSETKDLNLPQIGKIPAFCDNWSRTLDARIRSGESVELQFIEDNSSALLTESAIVLDVYRFDEGLLVLNEQAGLLEPKPSIFDQIQDLGNSIFAYRDQAELYGSLIDAKVSQMLRLLKRADGEVKELNNPANFLLLDALQAVWETVVGIYNDLHDEGMKLEHWTVPELMGVTEIAAAIYGDTSKAVDLMSLNPFEDPYAVPAGFDVRYYPA